MPDPARPRLLPRLRVIVGETVPMGPGKAELLGLLEETGSLSAAAGRMGISYMRAWTLLQTMNDSFASPLIELSRGGAKGGGSRLTPIGRRVLELYREMDAACLEATAGAWAELSQLLKPPRRRQTRTARRKG